MQGIASPICACNETGKKAITGNSCGYSTVLLVPFSVGRCKPALRRAWTPVALALPTTDCFVPNAPSGDKPHQKCERVGLSQYFVGLSLALQTGSVDKQNLLFSLTASNGVGHLTRSNIIRILMPICKIKCGFSLLVMSRRAVFAGGEMDPPGVQKQTSVQKCESHALIHAPFFVSPVKVLNRGPACTFP